METDDKSLIEHALELLVYAPVGLAITASEELPRLIDKGRSRVEMELANARAVGAFAVAQGQREAGRFVSQATRMMVRSDRVASHGNGSAPPRPARHPGGAQTADTSGAGTGPGPSEEPSGPSYARSVEADSLAIPGYDALSALHVVQRLDGLSPEELAAVACYEESHRARQTILNRVAQLQSRGS